MLSRNWIPLTPFEDSPREHLGWPPFDAGLPGLQTALNADRMREVFDEHFQFGKSSRRLEHCRLTRIRYRPAARAIVQYTLIARHHSTGELTSQVVTGSLHPAGRGQAVSQKLAKRLPIQEKRSGALQPVSWIPEIDMLVQSFPYDRRLPTLPQFASCPPAELLKKVRDDLGLGRWIVEPIQTEVVRYRAGLSAVVKYVIQARNSVTAQSREYCYYAKITRDASARDTTLKMLDAIQSQQLSIKTPRPVLNLPDRQAVVFEAAPGQTLEDLLLRGDARPQLRRFGRALAEFHQCGLAAPRRHSARQLMANLNRAAAKLQWAFPESASVVGLVAAYAAEAPDADFIGPTHRDLKAEHIFFDGQTIRLIDWDSLDLVDPVLDPAMLAARIIALAARHDWPRGKIDECKSAFFDSYFSNVPMAWIWRYSRHFAGAALEVAAGYFARQEYDWQRIVRALLNESMTTIR